MPNSFRLATFFGLAALAALPAIAAEAPKGPSVAAAPPSAAGIEFFEKKIRPLLANNCYNCHSANTNSQGGLRVDDRNGLLAGGGRGAAVVPGKPDESLLLRAVSHADKKLQMPPKKQLSEEEVGDLRKWIADGAAWPQVIVPADLGKPNAYYDSLRKTHWAWQPLTQPAAPAVKDAAWPRDDIDRFVLARLEAKGLHPVADAEKIDLIRRVSFDLTGLPPTPEEIDRFVADASPNAFEAVVDRLLASPAFGERWGRHWLDVARYGESTGSSRNLPMPHSWRYRDYVIKAFTTDKPYNRFLTEQIAGDLMPHESQAQREEQLVATGFLAIGVKDVNQRFKVRYVMDNIDEQIDAVGRAVLGLTASCARCHDHKFDPIPATDYYALAGIFHSTDLCAGLRNKMGGGGLDYYDTSMLLTLNPDAPADPAVAQKIEAKKEELKNARAELAAVRDDPEKKIADDKEQEAKLKDVRQKVNKLQAELVALTDPAVTGQVAFGVRDAKAVGDTGLRVRGEAEAIGPSVPRGFLSLVPLEGVPAVPPNQSGRLELAAWLTHDRNPLTLRVITNRVWHHLFGQGIVRSVDNFGTTGDEPSHPEVLDHLSARFVRDGWSVKKLVRAIVLSRTYRLSSAADATNAAADPAVRLVWRHRPRRLEAEELRDAMLTVAGRLDRTPALGSSAMNLKVIEISDNGAEAKRIVKESQESVRRSVYLPLVRGITPTPLAVFDFAEQGMVTGSRDVTTVAPQSLYMLNDPFVREQSVALARRLLSAGNDVSGIEHAYRLTLGRTPSTSEVSRAEDYLRGYAAALSGDDDNEPLVALAEIPSSVSTGDDKASSEELVGEAMEKGPAGPRLDARTTAWATFCQALFGSAEFRYLK